MKTTDVGFKNVKGCEVVGATGKPSTTMPGQTIYRLRCQYGHEFGVNGTDIHIRICPLCNVKAARGEPLD